jgi:hypothetical protein
LTVYNREIIRYITEDENYKRLEDILARETKEFYKLPWKNRWLDFEKKVRTQSHAEAVLAKAKEDADLFLGAEHAVKIPSLELKPKLTIQGYHLNSNENLSSLSLLATGLFVLYQWPDNDNASLTGMIIAAAGIAGGIVHFARKVKQNSPTYIPEEHKIICVTRKKSEVYCDMAHEYSHAVFMRSINDRKECMFANEGFAEGVSTVLSKRDNIKTGLANSVELLTMTRHYAKKKRLNKKDFFAPVIEKLHTGEETGYWEEMVMRSSGYAVFRLAEERYGTDVYREFLRGNTSILLE